MMSSDEAMERHLIIRYALSSGIVQSEKVSKQEGFRHLVILRAFLTGQLADKLSSYLRTVACDYGKLDAREDWASEENNRLQNEIA
jgi:hypothetical protein